MIKLHGFFEKGENSFMKQENRNTVIVRTGIVGIITNVLLSLAKITIGIFSNSIAIILDAVNNLSDALSSVITIGGIKLASRPADNRHPLGHGRYEYLSAMLVASIILAAGFTSFIESFKKLFSPEVPDYSAQTIVIIVLAIIVKIFLGRYTKNKGKETGSDSLSAAGTDALNDAVISAGTLIGIFVYLQFGLNIDSWIGIIIAVWIIKAGLEMLKDTLDDILGKRVDKELAVNIKKDIAEFDGVEGVFDLLLDSYGPERMVGFVHIEVKESITASKIDELSREIATAIYLKYNIILTVGVYAVPDENSCFYELYERIRKVILEQEGVLQIHGFHVDAAEKIVYFDVVRDFSITDVDKWTRNLIRLMIELDPQYRYVIIPDVNYSD